MIEPGDLFMVDLNEERHRRVLVVSQARFNRLSGRVLVAPTIKLAVSARHAPWHIHIGDDWFALHLIRSIAAERLTKSVGRAPADTVAAVRRAVTEIL